MINLFLFLSISILVILYVYLSNSSGFMMRSIQLIEKRVGHNLILLPKHSAPLDYYLCTDKQITISGDITAKLSANLQLASKYYVSLLHKRIRLKGNEFILTGIRPVKRSDETDEKGNMVKSISNNRAIIGNKVAELLHVKKGEIMHIGKLAYVVSGINPGTGSLDDYRIYIDLKQCQDILSLSGQIHAILALECLQNRPLELVEKIQRQLLARNFPELKQVTRMYMAYGRYMSRLTTRKYLYYLFNIIFIIIILIIVMTGIHEVMDRKQEIGIMISMGSGYSYIGGIYIVKTLIISMLSAVTGFIIGSFISISLNSSYLLVNTRPMQYDWARFPAILLMTCLVTVFAQIIPIIKLVRVDPCVVLTGE